MSLPSTMWVVIIKRSGKLVHRCICHDRQQAEYALLVNRKVERLRELENTVFEDYENKHICLPPKLTHPDTRQSAIAFEAAICPPRH